MGPRRSRAIGLAKTRLQRLVTATAIDLMRLAAWVGSAPDPRPDGSRSLAS